MADFSKLIITEQGKELLNSGLASEETLLFTQIAVSSHAYTENEVSNLDTIEAIVQQSSVRKVSAENDTVSIDIIVNNENVTEGYFIRTIALYAKLNNGTEKLFAAAIEKSGACYMPMQSETITSIQIKLRIKLDNTQNVNLIVDTGGLATIGDVLDIKNLLESHMSSLKTVAYSGSYNDLYDKPDVQTALDAYYAQLTAYTDKAIADLINGAPTTLDTLKELADAIADNQDITEALEAAIGAKANENELSDVAFTGSYSDLLNKPTTMESASKWTNARNINGMSMDGTADRFNYVTCSTPAYSSIKQVTCEGFELAAGAEISVKFLYGNTQSTLSLSVNSSAGYPITYEGTTLSPKSLVSNHIYTFRFSEDSKWEIVGDFHVTMKGATESAAGEGGLVPAPAAGEQDSFLKGDGTWGAFEEVEEISALKSDMTAIAEKQAVGYAARTLTKGDAAISLGACDITVVGNLITLTISTIQISDLGIIITDFNYLPQYEVVFPLFYNGSTDNVFKGVLCRLNTDGTIEAIKGDPASGWYKGSVTYVYAKKSDTTA